MYRIRVHGLPIRWRTEITEWNPPLRFVDMQLRGPYTLWHHTHSFEERDGGTPCIDDIRYFHDVVGALFKYREAHATRILKDFVQTSISKQIVSVLDSALARRKWALIRGNPGIGKTESLKAWCDAHRGESRYLSLTGINHRTAFFRELAKALGLPHTAALSASKVQVRVEDYLERSQLLLVIDEAQYLFPQQKRIHSHPELVNWLMTSCFNRGVPVVMSATLEFDRRRQAVEAQTTWSAEQFSRRIKRAITITDPPTLKDLQAVTESWLPRAPAPLNKYIVGYAMASKRFFDGVEEVIEDAELVARGDGREEIVVADEEEAIAVHRVPSDASLKRAFVDDPPPKAKGRPRQDRRNTSAADVQREFTEAPTAEDFAGRSPAGNVGAVTPGTTNRTNTLQPV